MIKSDTIAEIGAHVFEKAGLGIAPFRFIGMEEKTYQACPGAPIQPGGSCDYCGQAIIGQYFIQSADGKRFKVGCNCVNKTGDKGLIKAYKSSKEYRAKQRDARKRADDRVKAAWNLLISDVSNRAKLSAEFVTKYDGSLQPGLEAFERVWAMCGASGRAKYLRSLKKALAQ